MDVYNNSTANGGDVVQWANNGGLNQQWEFRSVSGGYFNIVNRNSGNNQQFQWAVRQIR